MKRIIALTMAVLMVVAMLAACGNTAQTKADESTAEATAAPAASTADSDAVKTAGKLVVGITDFEPMDYKDEKGEWIGFDADMARAFAESLGVTAEFVEVDWDNKILELDNKTIDCVWNGMTLTNEVKSAMETTNPYCNNAQVVVMKKDKLEAITGEEELKDLQFAVEAGSAGEAVAQEKGFKSVSVSTQADTLLEVDAGTSDASIIDLLMAGATIGDKTSYPGLGYKFELTSEEYGVGCRKGSDLAAYINDEFKKFYDDGSLYAIAEQFGVQESLLAQ